jgi:phosphoglucomutase
VKIHPLAGKRAPAEILIDVAALERAYFERAPDPADASQLVSFGTSGHRGSALDGTFNEGHVLAMAQAICDYRRAQGIDGPLLMGKDTHAVSGPAQDTALRVLAANGVDTVIQRDGGMTPTPVISRAILVHNRERARPPAGGRTQNRGAADGIVVTPSHNPPEDGGFKYNPPHGGPAETEVTTWIQERANALLRAGNREVLSLPLEAAVAAPTTRAEDFVRPYLRDLAAVIDLDVIRSAGPRLGVDPLGGASVDYWTAVREQLGLDLTVVNPTVDPTFRFMTCDHDGRIRMDCSSPYAMAGLVELKERFDVAFGNDADADRHGIVLRSTGLMNPNHYLAVAIEYLLSHRPAWPAAAAVGKTVVTSGLLDRVVSGRGRTLCETPVGFKWFASGLLAGSLCFGGEESAGASFLRTDGSVWTTDKDGLLLNLLAAEITARTGKDPGEHYRELTVRLGTPYYVRIDAAATAAEKARLGKLAPEAVTASTLAGEPILAKLTRAPGNDASIGGLKVVTRNGWFAARPSGTEDIYKLYAESFTSQSHLEAIVEEAQRLVTRVVSGG